MYVYLKDIDKDNFKECIALRVGTGQESYVATNLMSIAQSKFYPTIETCGIYAGDEMVGFAMFGFDPDEKKFYIVRLMIDRMHQGKGYGKLGALEAIERMKKNPECTEIYLSFVPANTDAEKLYEKIGFERTGEIDKESGEIIMRLTV